MRAALIIFLCAILLAGCTFLPAAGQRGERKGEDEAGQLVLPEAESAPPMVVDEKADPPTKTDYHALADQYQPEETAENLGRQRGYRVQILTTQNPDIAEEIKNNASNKLDRPVYRIYDPPYYKVRVGDCLSHEQAEELEKDVRKAGFETFIVRDIVEPEANEK